MQMVTKPGSRVIASKPWVWLSKPGPSLLEALVPTVTWVHKLVVSLALVGLITGLARASFYLPDNPVPITLQGFGVLIAGGVLGWRWGLVSILIYYFLGMSGVPVFKDGSGGWAYTSAGVTGGYLIGFIVSTWLVGYLSQRGWNRRSLWTMVFGMLVVYVPGLLWLQFGDYGWPAEGELFSSGMYPYIPGDLVKAMLAATVVGLGWRAVDKRNSG